MLTGPAKWGAFYCCDAFILPSHQENFGIAVIEALACAKPVLISDQVNIWHEIIKAKAGIVATDTLTGTLKLMEEWEKLTQEEHKRMAENGRRVFEKHFTIDRAAHNLLEAIS
jgi:glycosyltransferase involved in cell wall biosynthesis